MTGSCVDWTLLALHARGGLPTTPKALAIPSAADRAPGLGAFHNETIALAKGRRTYAFVLKQNNGRGELDLGPKAAVEARGYHGLFTAPSRGTIMRHSRKLVSLEVETDGVATNVPGLDYGTFRTAVSAAYKRDKRNYVFSPPRVAPRRSGRLVVTTSRSIHWKAAMESNTRRHTPFSIWAAIRGASPFVLSHARLAPLADLIDLGAGFPGRRRRRYTPRIFHIHREDPGNVGDMSSSPFQYLGIVPAALKNDFVVVGTVGITDPLPQLDPAGRDIVVVGGGGLMRCLDHWDAKLEELTMRSSNVIGWGSGINAHGITVPPDVPGYLGRFRLNGLRDAPRSAVFRTVADMDQGRIDGAAHCANTSSEAAQFYCANYQMNPSDTHALFHVPCASCLHRAFDGDLRRRYPLKRLIGIYAHSAHRVPHRELGPSVSGLLKAYGKWQATPALLRSVPDGLARLFTRFDEARGGMARCNAERASDRAADGCSNSSLVADVLYISNTTGLPLVDGGKVQALTNQAPHGLISEVVDFLASSALVLTSTYHGLFWATLLRVPVVVFGIFSSKFNSFPWPSVGWSGNLTLDAGIAGEGSRDYVTALSYCRTANRAFHGRVLELLETLAIKKDY